jgi:hypothetical protein
LGFFFIFCSPTHNLKRHRCQESCLSLPSIKKRRRWEPHYTFSRSIRSFSCFSCSLKASAVRFCVDLRTVRGISTAALCSATRGLARCLDAAAAEGAGRAAGVAALLGALIRTAFLAFLPGTLRAGRLCNAAIS